MLVHKQMKRKTREVEATPEDMDIEYRDIKKSHIDEVEQKKLDLHRKISILLIENLGNFSQVEDVNFRRLISQLAQIKVDEVPNLGELFFQVNELYLSYQLYFTHFFSENPGRTYSLTLHKWNKLDHLDQDEDYVFFNIQYINDEFQFFELPLGLFKLTNNKGEMNLGLIRNTILKNLTGKINFITTNFDLDVKSKNVIKFLLNDDFNLPNLSLELKYNDKILKCFPTIILDNFTKLINSLFPDTTPEWSQQSTIQFQRLLELAVGEKITELSKVDLSYIKPNRGFDSKKHFFKELQNENIISKLRSIVLYKQSLTEEHQSLLTEYQWQVLEFLSPLALTIQKLINGCSKRCGDGSEILKLIKYELFFLEQFYQHSIPKLNLLPPVFLKSFEEFSINLEKYHTSLSSKLNVLLATYLCPNTRKFLKDSEIQLIRYVFEKRAKSTTTGTTKKPYLEKEEEEITLSSDDTINMLDGIIMDIFQCAGNLNGEILMYESIKVKTNDQEDALKFWNQNQRKFPNLARVAQKVLPLQTNSYRNFGIFKENFATLQRQLIGYKDITTIEAMYYIYKMSTEIDLLLMKPNQLLDIERYQHQFSSSTVDGLTAMDISIPKL